MADFLPAFEKMIRNEGGYKLTNVPADRGGQTYAGIARNFFTNWPGWRCVDNQRLDAPELTGLVRSFYKEQFWDRIAGDALSKQAIAESIFDFAVNAGVATSAKLAQLVVGVTPDGGIGSKSQAALNAADPEAFVLKFTIAKISRYAQICNADRTRSQSQFLLGWINRALESLSLMSLLGVSEIITGVGKIADDLITTDQERLQAALEDKKLDLQGKAIDADLVKGQLDINKTEAASSSVFVAGWRPFIGWVGGIALAYQFIAYPLMLWVWQIAIAKGWIDATMKPPPVLDTQDLWVIVSGMLGIAGLRSFDKAQGTASTGIGALVKTKAK